MTGFYVGPFIKQLGVGLDDDDSRANAFSVGLTSGIQWTAPSSLSLEFVVGIGTYSVDYRGRRINFNEEREEENYLLNLGVAIGYCF